MKKLNVVCIAAVLVVLIVACGPSVGPTDTQGQSLMPTYTPRTQPTVASLIRPTADATNGKEPLNEGVCDPSIDRVGMNTRVSKRVQGSSSSVSCEAFCLCVPDGSRLDIGISDFVVDLDIYVDVDLSILEPQDNGRWESDAFGTVDEQVSIQNPGGCYYMKVCSYEGEPGTFILWNDFTP